MTAPSALAIRAATPRDWPAMAALVHACFAEYTAFAPPGWTPPPAERELGQLRARMAPRDGWARVVGDGSHLGHVALHDAHDEPGIVHVMHLFLVPRLRGTGIAVELLALAVAEARRRRAREVRLNTPVGQDRARAFYAREGWREVGAPFVVPDLGLPLLELRRALD